MQHRTVFLVAALLSGIGRLAAPAAACAQAAPAASAAAPSAVQLESLSRERVRRWAATAPTLRCAPAPLTERPTAGAEFGRPRVAPLEAAFLDAATVKRTIAAGGGQRPGASGGQPPGAK